MTSLTERALRGALAFSLACVCAGPALAAEPIVIGEINPLTGALALQDTSVLRVSSSQSSSRLRSGASPAGRAG